MLVTAGGGGRVGDGDGGGGGVCGGGGCRVLVKADLQKKLPELCGVQLLKMFIKNCKFSSQLCIFKHA